MYLPAGYNLTPGSMLNEDPTWSREASSTRRMPPANMGSSPMMRGTGYVDSFNPSPWERYRNPFPGVSDFDWRIPPTFDPIERLQDLLAK